MMTAPEAQLEEWLDKYRPETAALGRAVLTRMREIVPPCKEIVYDNYNGLVVGFGPTERTSDAVLSVQLQPKWVNLFFLRGVDIEDPHRLLKGSGNQVRSVRLTAAEDLDHPKLLDLIEVAIASSRVPFPEDAERELIIRSSSEKQRPRRP